jgi:beta-glucosidase
VVTASTSALEGLSLEEKVSLLSGRDKWSLPALPVIGLEPIVMSDGPSGVKGDGSLPIRSALVPCGVALAASWNTDLVEAIGALLGETARANGVHVLLAPATNMLRSPLGGRNFEYYSEDPLLAGKITCAYVRGVQSAGVAATVKHFVCNDAETHRFDGNVSVDEQTLREIYLLPFELAVREANAWAVMCSYNKLRGTHMSAQPLLDDVLRSQWGFDGVVVSDWGAVHDTVEPGLNGLDVEMPGPPEFWGARLIEAVRSGEVPEACIDEKVMRILRLARRTGAMGRSSHELTAIPDGPDVSSIVRKAAIESFVLLKNDDDVLPFDSPSRIALLGAHAAQPALQGGGSANVGPSFGVSPLDGIRRLAGETAEVVYEPGYAPEAMPRLDLSWVTALDGAEGFTVEIFDTHHPSSAPLRSTTQRANFFILDNTVEGRPLRQLLVRVTATLTPPVDGEYVFGIDCSGSASVRIDGEELLTLAPEHGRDWSALFRADPRGIVRATLESGRPVRFELDFRTHPGPRGEIGLITLRAFPPAPEDLLRRAVQLASDADVAVVFAGLGEEFESEGFDRSSLALPTEQLELIAAVAAANPATVVVVSAGAQVLMDWAEQVPAVLLVWYSGQEFGDALAQVLVGQAEPGGRLPMTFPARPEDAPVLEPGPDDLAANEWHYREGLFVGYRHYDCAQLTPAYCFGHGFGYTTFDYEDLRVKRKRRTDRGLEVEAAVRVRNTGSRRGKAVVQLYVGSGRAERPRWELRAFQSIVLDAGNGEDVRFTLDERAFSQWDTDLGGWAVLSGSHAIAIGSSSRDLRLTTTVDHLARNRPERRSMR